MFFHIPLCVRLLTYYRLKCERYLCSRAESYSAADVDSKTGRPLDVGLHDLEEPGAAKRQDGFFHKGLLQALESDHRAGGRAPEVKVVANGHCHREHLFRLDVYLSDV